MSAATSLLNQKNRPDTVRPASDTKTAKTSTFWKNPPPTSFFEMKTSHQEFQSLFHSKSPPKYQFTRQDQDFYQNPNEIYLQFLFQFKLLKTLSRLKLQKTKGQKPLSHLTKTTMSHLLHICHHLLHLIHHLIPPALTMNL